MSKKYIGVLTVSIASSFICKRTLTHTLISPKPKPRFGDCSRNDVYSSLVLLFLCCIRNTGGGSLLLLCQVNQIAYNSLFKMPSKLVFAGSRRLILIMLHEYNTSRIQIHDNIQNRGCRSKLSCHKTMITISLTVRGSYKTKLLYF